MHRHHQEGSEQSPDGAPKGRSGGVARKLLLIAFGLLVAGLFLVVVELTLALLGLGDADRFSDPYVGFESTTDLFSERSLDDGTRAFATAEAKLEFFNLQSFPVAKAPGTYRIFTLGGSTTAGRPYDDQVSFSRWLERYLGAADPSRHFEVINAGAISYASYRVVVVMKELVRYSPDLFIVYTGHNEFLEERTYRELARQNAVRKWLRSNLLRFRLARLVATAGGAGRSSPGSILEEEVKTRLDVFSGLDAYHRDDELTSSILEHFTFNLEQMALVAGQHQVPLLFVAPLSNLKDFSPFKSEHSIELTPALDRRFASLLEQSRRHLADLDWETALALLLEARAIDPEFAEEHYRAGQAHFGLGDYAAARTAFVKAKDLDVAPLRALESIVDRVRERARLDGIPLIDLPALIEADSSERYGHDIPGNEYLLDHVHPDLAVHSLIAERNVAFLSAEGVISASLSEARRSAVFEGVVADLDRDYYARRDLNLGKVLGWAGKLEEAEGPLLRAAEVLANDADLQLNLGTLWLRTGRLDQAAVALEESIRLNPRSPEAHFNLGVVEGRRGRLEHGIASLEEALRIRPDYAEAHHNLGILKRQSGRIEDSVRSLERARELAPDSPEVSAALVRSYRLAGRTAEAADLVRAGAAETPDSADTFTETGVALARSGHLDQAIVELERALRLDSSHAEAHYNLGKIWGQKGDTSRAIETYRRTIEIEETHVLAHTNLGILLARTGELEAALHHLTTATELGPGNSEAHLNLAVVYDLQRRPLDAIRTLENALESTSASPRIHLALAMLYSAQGRRAESLPHFRAAQAGGEAIPEEIARQL